MAESNLVADRMSKNIANMPIIVAFLSCSWQDTA